MDRAIEAVSIYKSNRQPPYSVTGSDSEGYIVYDVYGIDVKIYPPSIAEVIFRTDTQRLNSIYETLFEQLLYRQGRPSMNGRRATFSGYSDTSETRTDYKYVLDFNPLGQNVSFRYEKTTVSLIDQNRIRVVGDFEILLGKVNSIDAASIRIYNGNNQNVIIPNAVGDIPIRVIDTNVFAQKQLKSIIFPDTITHIGYGSFQYNQLTNVVLPNEIQQINNYAFYKNKLKTITIPATVQRMGEAAFADNEIEDIILENGLKSIGHFVFQNNKLTSVLIPGSVTYIGNRAFYDNPITEIRIGANVELSDIDPFPHYFREYYYEQNRQAGRYVLATINNTWWKMD
jgi:hypothetical protein